MYFEPTKKTYYRFPSVHSVNEFDAKNYFPDKPHAEEATRFEAQLTNHIPNRDSYSNL